MNVGDWSNDGHGICEKVIVDIGLTTLGTLKDAYKASCRRLGMQFHSNTMPDVPKQPIRLCVEYEDASVPPEAVKIFEEHGWKPDQLGIYAYPPGEGKGAYFDGGPAAFVNLLMWFCGLSLSEFNWRILSETRQSFNGYGGGFSNHFGYGLRSSG